LAHILHRIALGLGFSTWNLDLFGVVSTKRLHKTPK
jgi:hypothetical protein